VEAGSAEPGLGKTVTVTVLYFAGLSERLGLSHDTIELPCATTAEEVLTTLSRLRPAARELFTRSRLAVDLDFVQGPLCLSERSEVAVIPPVSGG
jgi:molybdopterin converting factor subunit 1